MDALRSAGGDFNKGGISFRGSRSGSGIDLLIGPAGAELELPVSEVEEVAPRDADPVIPLLIPLDVSDDSEGGGTGVKGA